MHSCLSPRRMVNNLCLCTTPATELVGLRYTGGLELEGMCDSSWGDDIDDRRSQAAFVFTMGGTAVSWKSWKIGEVSRSTTETE